MKFIFVILSIIFNSFFGMVTAQSKKEQISVLSDRVDSLFDLIKNERLVQEIDELRSQNKVDSMVNKIKVINDDLNRIVANTQKSIVEIELIKDRNKLLEDELVYLDIENKMIFVEGGTFQMGSDSVFVYKHPIQKVTVRSFFISKYEVTRGQWKTLMHSNDGRGSDDNRPSDFWDCDQCPVDGISWDNSQEFIRRLNAQTGLNYRLPNEAEWEFAARGGNFSKRYLYSGSNEINSVAWNSSNSQERTHPVGTLLPNELGIYDMSGNVSEWCSEFYIDSSGFTQRIYRGGMFGGYHDHCLNSERLAYYQSGGTPYNGFRLVLPVSP
jgi:formylglycine-generating enzyme required for sulfatase activity